MSTISIVDLTLQFDFVRVGHKTVRINKKIIKLNWLYLINLFFKDVYLEFFSFTFF